MNDEAKLQALTEAAKKENAPRLFQGDKQDRRIRDLEARVLDLECRIAQMEAAIAPYAEDDQC